MNSIEQITASVKQCQMCELAQYRNNAVAGEGPSDAEFMFIGEAPGKEEDLAGRPFVGRSGELLSMALEKLSLHRSSVFITNIVKCRPTVDNLKQKDRPPQPVEINSCLPYLEKQIDLMKPRSIITLGSVATRTLLGTKTPISKLRGSGYLYRGVNLYPCFHPSYILRNGGINSTVAKTFISDLHRAIADPVV